MYCTIATLTALAILAGVSQYSDKGVIMYDEPEAFEDDAEFGEEYEDDEFEDDEDFGEDEY